MNDQYLSTKEIADLLKVSKQRVYRCIKDNCINEALKEVVRGNTVYKYDSAAVTRIREILEKKDSTSDEAVNVHHDALQKSSENDQKSSEAHYEAVNETLLIQWKNSYEQRIQEQKEETEQRLKEKDRILQEQKEKFEERLREKDQEIQTQIELYEKLLADKKQQIEEKALLIQEQKKKIEEKDLQISEYITSLSAALEKSQTLEARSQELQANLQKAAEPEIKEAAAIMQIDQPKKWWKFWKKN